MPSDYLQHSENMPKCEVCRLAPSDDSVPGLAVCSTDCLAALQVCVPGVRIANISALVLSNTNYRTVWDVSGQSQSVLMSLLPSEDIPNEVHPWTTQEIVVYAGQIEVTINDTVSLLLQSTGSNQITIHAGFHHAVKPVGSEIVKLYVRYSPPEHAPGLVQPRQSDGNPRE